MTINVNREHLPAVARVLRDDPALRFEICTGVSGVHYPDRAGEELHAVYHLLSITNGGRRVRSRCRAPDDDPHIPSIVSTSTRPTTGTSARRGTCSGSSSTATRP